MLDRSFQRLLHHPGSKKTQGWRAGFPDIWKQEYPELNLIHPFFDNGFGDKNKIERSNKCAHLEILFLLCKFDG